MTLTCRSYPSNRDTEALALLNAMADEHGFEPTNSALHAAVGAAERLGEQSRATTLKAELKTRKAATAAKTA